MKGNVIDFYYFTGTGNTLLAVRKMVEVFRESGKEVNLLKMEDSNPKSIDTEHVIGLGFPVAAQSTFPLVWDFVRAMPEASGTEAFMVDTVWMFSGAIVGPIKRVMSGKGYETIAGREMYMPGNWFPGKINEERNRKLVDWTMRRAGKYAGEILDGTARWRRIPLLSDAFFWLNTRPFVWRKLAEIGDKFAVDPEKCKACDICVRLCPVDNITMGEVPAFAGNCQQCMRCIAFCPNEAISVPGKKYALYRAVKVKDILGEKET